MKREEILSQYKKEDLIHLYDEYRNMYKVADAVGCDYRTLFKLFKSQNIEVGKFLRQPRINKKLDHLTKEILEKLLQAHSIKEVAKLQNAHPGQIVARMVELDITRKRNQPHHKNRAMLSLPNDLFAELVKYRGVLGTAHELKCSQSAIRDRANKLGIILTCGPHPALTATAEWQKKHMEASLKGVLACPNKNTSIELALQEALAKANIPFEPHQKIIDLTVPDIFIKPNICVYADGCYWHGCDLCKISDKNSGLKYTKTHDNFVNRQLQKAGYIVLRFWEHEIKQSVGECIHKISGALSRATF